MLEAERRAKQRTRELRKLRNPFSVTRCLARAQETFANAPAKPFIERPVPRGELVARFVLPLELCQEQNTAGRDAMKGRMAWRSAAIKRDCYAFMLPQVGRPWDRPLEGRPQVLCTRFSVQRPDVYANWAKNPVDRLRPPQRWRRRGKVSITPGLGIIREDNPEAIDEVQWWEPCRRGEGFCLIRVYTG